MKLSEQLDQDDKCGDSGMVLEGYRKKLERKINVLKHTICELEREVARLKSEKENGCVLKERSGEQVHCLDVTYGKNIIAQGKYRTGINQTKKIRSDDE